MNQTLVVTVVQGATTIVCQRAVEARSGLTLHDVLCKVLKHVKYVGHNESDNIQKVSPASLSFLPHRLIYS